MKFHTYFNTHIPCMQKVLDFRDVKEKNNFLSILKIWRIFRIQIYMDVLAKEYRDDLCILVDMLKEMILFPYDMAYTMY